MPTLFHQSLTVSVRNHPNSTAIIHKDESWTYQQLTNLVHQQAQALQSIGLMPLDRVGIYLPKQIKTVTSFLSTSLVGGVFVPINPILKAPQVQHILNDCSIKILITSKTRLKSLTASPLNCPDLKTIIIVENNLPADNLASQTLLSWKTFTRHQQPLQNPTIIDSDIACILYTSGSTGKPKGVIVSHNNLIIGAKSVSEFLNITSNDKLLAILPFSFDYGLNQLTTCILQGACCVLHDYLLPNDIIKAVTEHKITGVAGVPSLFFQVSSLLWPPSINSHLRYLTNSGGKLSQSIIEVLQAKLPSTQLFLMYGLTEAFRSTYLPPEKIKRKPDSIGKAIPNVRLHVVRPDGTPCLVGEPGELVHCGPLVTLGYWNNKKETQKRYKPDPSQSTEKPLQEIAVWSGDNVKFDNEGYLYFLGRDDEMIKTSGYRVSPFEIENEIYKTGLINEAIAIGINDPKLGQKILLLVSTHNDKKTTQSKLIMHCKQTLPNYMIPTRIIVVDEFPKNHNGKIDKTKLVETFNL